MAKLKAPLLSLGASGAIGKTLVFFGWKGLDVVREYVVPANPKTDPQKLQRGYLKQAVLGIHQSQAWVAHPLDEVDTSAFALWGSTFPTPRTWFNQALKGIVDMLVAEKSPVLFSDGSVTEGTDELTVAVTQNAAYATAGRFYYGVTKTALVHSIAADLAEQTFSKTIPNLETGMKYFIQFRPTEPDAAVGARSGIYHGTPD